MKNEKSRGNLFARITRTTTGNGPFYKGLPRVSRRVSPFPSFSVDLPPALPPPLPPAESRPSLRGGLRTVIARGGSSLVYRPPRRGKAFVLGLL